MLYKLIAFLPQKLGDIDSNLKDFEVPLQDEAILNDETVKGLEDLANSNVDDIEFETFFNEVRHRL